MENFNREVVKHYYLDLDVTNYFEITSFTILSLLNLWLMIKILLNFKSVLNWYLRNNREVDPRKLLCINSMLLISTICIIVIFHLLVKIMVELYAIFGCLLSNFANFSSEQKDVYFNIVIYRILETLYV